MFSYFYNDVITELKKIISGRIISDFKSIFFQQPNSYHKSKSKSII